MPLREPPACSQQQSAAFQHGLVPLHFRKRCRTMDGQRMVLHCLGASDIDRGIDDTKCLGSVLQRSNPAAPSHGTGARAWAGATIRMRHRRYLLHDQRDWISPRQRLGGFRTGRPHGCPWDHRGLDTMVFFLCTLRMVV